MYHEAWLRMVWSYIAMDKSQSLCHLQEEAPNGFFRDRMSCKPFPHPPYHITLRIVRVDPGVTIVHVGLFPHERVDNPVASGQQLECLHLSRTLVSDTVHVPVEDLPDDVLRPFVFLCSLQQRNTVAESAFEPVIEDCGIIVGLRLLALIWCCCRVEARSVLVRELRNVLCDMSERRCKESRDRARTACLLFTLAPIRIRAREEPHIVVLMM